MKKICFSLFVVVMLLGMLIGIATAAGFDASFELTESQDGNTVTITIRDIPGGEEPILSVPCGDDWTKAIVTREGTPVDGDITFEYDEDLGANYVSFTVTEGGTYVIQNVCVITFDSNGGTAVEAKEVLPGGRVDKPDDPAKAGYLFAGWLLDGQLYNFEAEVTESITLEAQWQYNCATIHFDSKGGAAVSSETIDLSEKTAFTKPTAPGRSGYTFLGWFDETLANEFDFSELPEAGEEITVYAKWKKKTVAPVIPPVEPEPDAPTPETDETGTPSVDTDAPVVNSTSTENEDGSTTKTETLGNGTVIETTNWPDGSTTATATKIETVENEEGKTTTTTTTCITTIDSSGSVVKESREEVVVETEEGIVTTTTVMTESEDKTEKTVAESKTTVDETGKESVVTTSKTETAHANGSTGSTVEENGKVTAEVTLSEQALIEAAEEGKAVVLPMPAVEAKDDAAEAPVITVNTAATAEAPVTVEIPVADVKPGSVVVLVHEDGTEEVVPKTVQTKDGLAVRVEGNVTVKIVDNAKDFADTENHWAADAIDHASSRELFNGVSDTDFAPNTNMNRAMLATVLWRMEGKQEAVTESNFDDVEEGHWSEEATHWAAEQGIIQGDGTSFNGDDDVTREQMVTMLYRMNGSPEVSAEDMVEGASSWAANAVAWAVKIGLLQGDGTGLNLQGSATRAQIATFLMRYMNMRLGI